MSMFEKASRLKLRFDTNKGQLTVDDLWDLPLTSQTGKANLDDVARSLHRQLKNDDNVSFVETNRRSDETIQLKFDIVRHIIDVRLAEMKAASEARTIAQQKQMIMELIADKKVESLKSLSVEELENKLKEIGQTAATA